MKILNILLANTLLTSGGGVASKNIKSFNNFGFLSSSKNTQILPFVEVSFNLDDYVYFQEGGDYESIVDYIITSNKINIDEILKDPLLEEKINELIKKSALTQRKVKETLLEIIAIKIIMEVHDSYKKDVEEITGKSSSSSSASSGSSSSSKTFTPALTKANWLLSNLGTAAILEWFDAEYGAKGSDSKGTGGEAKWEATVDYTTKVHTYAKADDGRLQTLFGTWKAKGGSNYNAKKDAFIGAQPSDVDKKIIWQNNNNANYLSAYNTWRASAVAGKGQAVLKPIWKATTSGAYNYQEAQNQWKSASGQLSDWKADTTSTGGDSKLTAFMADVTKKSEILTFWKTYATDDGFDTKAAAWLADVNAGAPLKTKKAWYWSNSFRAGVDSWIQGLTSGSAGVSDESLVKSAWYFSPDYVDKAQHDLYNDKTTDAQLDAWLATSDGREAIRHFAANNPLHAISTKFFDYWKSQSNSNYNFQSSKWLNRVNKIGNTNRTRVKPSKTAWINQGHNSWDTYKIWAEGAARTDSAIVTSLEGNIPVPVSVNSDAYKNSATSDVPFSIWFNGLDSGTKRAYYKTGYFVKWSGPGHADKNNFLTNNQRNYSWGTNNSVLKNRVGEKLTYSLTLKQKWDTYLSKLYQANPGNITPAHSDIEKLWENVANATVISVFNDLHADAAKAGNTDRINAAKDFKDSYENDNHLATRWKWRKSWYDLESSDLDWNLSYNARFYWISANSITKDTLITYANNVYNTQQKKINAFEQTPLGQSWKAVHNPTPAQLSTRVTKSFNDKEEWIYQSALNVFGQGTPAPSGFTTWKNNFEPLYISRPAYTNYIGGLSTSDKKALGTAKDDFISTPAALTAYKKWRNDQDSYQDEISKKLLKDYDATYKTQYESRDISDKDYENWSPWYIKNHEQYDLYVRNALELEESTPISSPLYLRYMASRYKEDDAFYVGNSFVKFKHWLWGWKTTLNMIDINQMFRHNKLPVDATVQEQLDTAEPMFLVDVPEYQGGFTQKKAYENNVDDFYDITSALKDRISINIMENHQDIFLDIATRYPNYYVDNLSGTHVTGYLQTKGLFSKKWLSEFSDSNLEAYYAYRDKFIDNSNTERTKVTPFSDNDITSVAVNNLTNAEKRLIYGHTKHMKAAGKITTRTNQFLSWAKDNTKKYSPILINHYFSNDNLSKTVFNNWNPYWLHSKADYEKIFTLSESNIDLPLVGGETKTSKLAKTQDIALIKYFTKEMAQSQLAGNGAADKTNAANGSGQQFWNTIWNNKKSANIYTRIQNNNYLWSTLYKHHGLAQGYTNIFNENFKSQWQDELLAFDYLDYIIDKMEEGNDIDFDSSFIDANQIKISQQFIDEDKTKLKEPQSDINDFKTNKKDDIWTKLFLAKEANYKTDYEAWLSGRYDTTAAHDATFEKWSKVLTNGQVEFLAHSDATSAMRNWVIPTLKIQAEYDIINPTWDNLKLLWAKETFLSWKLNTGHFYNWFNSKIDFNGVVSDDFLSAYRLEPIGVARRALDEDGTYSKAEESAHIINDFKDRAWWLIKYYIDQTASAPSEFTTWLNLYNIPAKRDLIAEIDAGNLDAETKATYKASDEHLNGYKSWRNAISSSSQRVEYNGLAVSNTKYDDYKANYDGWS